MDNHPTTARIEPHRWVAGMADAIMALGTPRFWDALVMAISSVVGNQGAVVFRYKRRREPSFVFSDFRSEVSRGEFRRYRTRAYLLDPFYLAFLDRRPSGVYRLRQLAADRFSFSEYYRTYYAQTGLSDEIGMFCWLKPDDLLILSLAKRKGATGLSEPSIRELGMLQPMVNSLVRRHVGTQASGNTSEQASPQEAAERLDFGSDGVLTHREIEVANLILRGHSSLSMAYTLDISVETVKVHRRHIYRKLNISSQAELFSLAIRRSTNTETGI